MTVAGMYDSEFEDHSLWDIHNISEGDNKGAENMLDYCGMSQYNWQTTLIGWYNICNPQMITNKPNVGALGLLYNMYYNWQVYGNTTGDFDPNDNCLLYTSPSPRDRQKSRMPSSA